MHELVAGQTLLPMDPSLGWVASFTFPFKTQAHTNRRGNAFARHRAVRKEREALFYAWYGAGCPKPPRWPVKVTFTRIAPRKLDAGDNLPSAFKGMRDELTLRLGLRNDAGPEVEWLYEQVKPQDLGLQKGEYGVKVTLQVERRAA